MSETFLPLGAATGAFVLGHLLLSSVPVRTPLIARLGRWPFLALYAGLALAAFIWMNMAYLQAPFIQLWPDQMWSRWLSVLLMPLACILLVAGVLTANPAAVGQERLLEQADPAPGGIQAITRHPVLWAIALWAALHLAANGDVASLIFFGGFLALCLLGMLHIDARRRAAHGDLWNRYAARTGFIPFLAILTGRIAIRPGQLARSIGWTRIGTGLALYAAFLFGHRYVIDVPLLPQLGL